MVKVLLVLFQKAQQTVSVDYESFGIVD